MLAATSSQICASSRAAQAASENEGVSITTSMIIAGKVRPLLRDGVPDPDRCDGNDRPMDCNLHMGESRDAVVGGYLMNDFNPNDIYDLPESQVAIRVTRTPVSRAGKRGTPFSNTEICRQGLTPTLDGCAEADGIMPIVHLERRDLDMRVVSFDARRSELSWPTKVGWLHIRLGQESADRIKEELGLQPSHLTVDYLVTMPRKTDRGYLATVVQEKTKADGVRSHSPRIEPIPDPLPKNHEELPVYGGPGASCPATLEGVWQPADAGMFSTPVTLRCGTVVTSSTGCPGCWSSSSLEASYRIEGDMLIISYTGRSRTTSHGDMHPPGVPWDVRDAVAAARQERFRIAPRCPAGFISDRAVLREVMGPRCLTRMTN